MRNIWTIARREYRLFFISPIAYVIAFTFTVILGIIFYMNVVSAMMGQYPLDLTIILGPMVTLFFFTTPAITMRALAEEQRSGTLEILLTAPIRDFELVVGKWLGGFLFLLTLILVTLIYPFILNRIMQPGLDTGTLLSGYAGIILMASAIAAVGTAVSSLFGNQIAAFFTTLGILLVFWMIGSAGQTANGTVADLIKYLDFNGHFFNTFYQGIIDLQDIVYYLSLTALALFLGTLSIETRRWR